MCSPFLGPRSCYRPDTGRAGWSSLPASGPWLSPCPVARCGGCEACWQRRLWRFRSRKSRRGSFQRLVGELPGEIPGVSDFSLATRAPPPRMGRIGILRAGRVRGGGEEKIKKSNQGILGHLSACSPGMSLTSCTHHAGLGVLGPLGIKPRRTNLRPLHTNQP